jgi:hypothetical protein
LLFTRKLLFIAAACWLGTVGLAPSSLAETSAEGHNARLEWDQFAHDYPIHVAIDYVVALQVQEGATFVAAVQEAEAQAARAALVRQRNVVAVTNGPSSGSSYQALANCEQGGRNHPYFGYFSIMDGSAGGKSWDQQVAMVQAIKARAGAGAWDGCARYVP